MPEPLLESLATLGALMDSPSNACIRIAAFQKAKEIVLTLKADTVVDAEHFEAIGSVGRRVALHSYLSVTLEHLEKRL